jgi:hypothetical protein
MRLGVSHTHADTAKIAVIETQGGTADSDYVDGVVKLDGRLPILLNPSGLLSGLDRA